MSSLPNYRVIVAFDRQRVGDVIQPTGLLRERLLRLKFIEACEPAKPAALVLTPPRAERRSRHA